MPNKNFNEAADYIEGRLRAVAEEGSYGDTDFPVLSENILRNIQEILDKKK